MSSPGLLKQFLTGFAVSLAPLSDAVASPEAFAAFLQQFGWTLESQDLAHVTASLGPAATLPDDPSALSMDELVAAVAGVTDAIHGIASSGAPAAFASTFPDELLDFLIYTALAQHGPQIFAILHLVGVLREEHRPADPATARTDYIARQVHWDRLQGLTSDPAGTVEQSYGWGSDFDADGFLRSIGIMVQAFGGHAGLYGAVDQLVDEYYAPEGRGNAGIINLIVSVPYLDASLFGDGVSASTSIALLGIPIPPSPDVPVADGLALMPLITGQASDSLPLSDRVTLTLSGDVLTRPVRAELHPHSSVVRASPGDSHVDAAARVDAKAPPAAPWLAFGDATSTRLEITAAHASLGLSGTLDGDLDLRVEVGLDAATLVVELGDSDGFVRDTLSAQPVRSPVSLVVSWSSASGFSLGGQPTLAVTIPVGRTAGPITITSVGFALGVEDGAATLDATVTAIGSIGPISASIADVGLRARLTPGGSGGPAGNLGSADLRIGAKQPSGAGLSVAGGIISGGGFIRCDPTNGRYSGVLDLKAGQVDITALGLLETKLPGGHPGYALLIALHATFPAIEIGFGFALTGVGGLIGLNRRVDVDALRNRLASGTAGRILAPQDPVKNAPALLADLDLAFPVAPGITVIGPTVQLVWADLVHFDIGVFIELPGPARVVLLGSANAEIQRDGKTYLSIRVEVLGVVDVHAEKAAFDAVLVDSHLLGVLDLTGGAAFRMSWGDQPYSVLTLGGFNPSYNPEPLTFPSSLTRIAMVHGTKNDEVYLRYEGYYAVTSNTLQFGAAVEALIQSGGFVIHGTIGYDVLIQFVPFHFQFDIRACVDVSFRGHHLAGLTLTGSLSGPGPVVLQAKVCIEILFFDICFSHTFELGSPAAALEAVAADLLDTLLQELTAPGRLRGGGTADPHVRLRPPEPDVAVLVVIPTGGLVWQQQKAPLGLFLDRVGGTPLPAPVQVQATAAVSTRPATDWFAPGQFIDLTDDQALTRPAYELLSGGVRLAGTAHVDGPSAPKTLLITQIRLPARAARTSPFPAFPTWLVEHPPRTVVPVISVTTEAWIVTTPGGELLDLTGAQARRVAALTTAARAVPGTDRLPAFSF